MKRFYLKADFSFEAEDLDDALLLLAHKFLSDSLFGIDAPDLKGELGEIRLEGEKTDYDRFVEATGDPLEPEPSPAEQWAKEKLKKTLEP